MSADSIAELGFDPVRFERAYARFASRQSDEELVEHAIRRIESTDSGREIAQLLRERRDRIVVLDEPGGVLPPGAGGRWDGSTQKLYILRSELEHPAGPTLLAHEGVHMRDASSRFATIAGSMKEVGRGLVDMVVAPIRLRNPVTAAIDGIRGAWQIPMETDAYHLQAQVSHELGFVSDWLQHPDSTPRSEDELRERLLEDDLYQLPPLVRGGLGAGFAWIGGRASAQAVNSLAHRIAPNSWVGRHGSVVTGASLAIWAGLVVQDQLAARR